MTLGQYLKDKGKKNWIIIYSELVYFKTWQHQSEANRFYCDFVPKTRKKTNFFFENESQKMKVFDNEL